MLDLKGYSMSLVKHDVKCGIFRQVQKLFAEVASTTTSKATKLYALQQKGWNKVWLVKKLHLIESLVVQAELLRVLLKLNSSILILCFRCNFIFHKKCLANILKIYR